MNPLYILISSVEDWLQIYKDRVQYKYVSLFPKLLSQQLYVNNSNV